MNEIIEIPVEQLHSEMLKLRNEQHMDFLRSLTGMDWQEEGLGVIYHLENTQTGENKVVRARTRILNYQRYATFGKRQSLTKERFSISMESVLQAIRICDVYTFATIGWVTLYVKITI